MQLRYAVIVSIFALVLGGCAGVPQGAVALAPAKISSAAVRIGVVMAPMPKVDTSFPGADCLLCMAAAGIANSSMTSYVQTMSSNDLSDVKSEIAALLRKKGATVKMIDEPLNIADLPSARGDGPNIAKKDFTALAAKYGVEKLVVISIVGMGVERTYAAYFPTSAPRAYVSGTGFMVNLADNSYDWYVPFKTQRATDGEWDEPPKFPGMTNAYFQAVEATKDALKTPFTE